MTNALEARGNFSLNKISMTKPAFTICIETFSIAQQTYMPLRKPVFYLVIREQLSTFAAMLLRELLWEDFGNINNIVLGFKRAERAKILIVCEGFAKILIV